MVRCLLFLKNYPWIIPLFISSILLILGANAHPLWADEAETAFFAKTILQTGLPKGFDGVNMSAVNNATVLNKDLLNHVTPPLQYYLMALSFLIFGQSAFSARLPFLMFGMVNIILFYYLSLKLSEGKRAVPIISVTIYSLCIPIILFSGQARYYSLTIFSGLLLCHSSLFLIDNRKKLLAGGGFVLAGLFYIYSHYLTFSFFYLSLYLSLLCYFLLKKKGFSLIKSFSLKYFGLGMGVVVLFLPWYFIFKPSENQGVMISFSLGKFFVGFINALSYFHYYSIFPYIFIFLLVVIFIVKKAKKNNFNELLMVVAVPVFYLIFLAFCNAVVSATNLVIYHSRYNLSLAPFFIFLVAAMIYEIAKFNKIVACALILLYMTTTVFTFQHYRSFLWEYINEVVDPYPISDQLVADYLKTNTKMGDTAFVNYDRSHEPLIFLLGDRIKFVNRISPFRISAVKNPELPKYLYNYIDDPDWVILYSRYGKRKNAQYLLDIRDPNAAIGRTKKLDLKNDYQEIVLPVFFVSDIARPEIEWRSFEEIKPTYEQQVFIYRKKQ